MPSASISLRTLSCNYQPTEKTLLAALLAVSYPLHKSYLVDNCMTASINKNLFSFTNAQFNSQWQDICQLKKETIKAQYVKTIENLSKHTKQLPPLWIGDHIFEQNWLSNAPGKWDCSGVILESKGHDQYVVKIAGTGRLTLRNW